MKKIDQAPQKPKDLPEKKADDGQDTDVSKIAGDRPRDPGSKTSDKKKDAEDPRKKQV
jgi:hypothetical protein